MKIVTTLIVLVASTMCFAQDYLPFNSSTSKRFFESGNPVDNDFFFHTTNTDTLGDTLVFDQYYSLVENGLFNDVPGCFFWGGAVGIELDTTWLGNQLKWNTSSKELLLKNNQSEQLNFDFGIAIGTSTPFYTNGGIEYRIEHTSNSLLSFYGVSDSIQHYEIQAFDIGGSPVFSDLNNFEIKLSKNYGLISFINCYDFPMLEQRLELEGQTNPTIGHYQLTYDDCYPWITGDIVQYSTNNSYAGSFPANKIAYQTGTVTDRIETTDSVKIYLSTVLHEANPALPITPFVVLGGLIQYKKGTVVSEKPWNMSQLDPELSRGSEFSLNWCGSPASFHSDEEFSHYCDSCKCYGSYDGFSQVVKEEQFAAGLGKFRIVYKDYGYPTNGGSRTGQIIYSNINGVECGTFWNGQEELFQFELAVSPNPTKDILKLEADQAIQSIRVSDLSGRSVLIKDQINQKTTEISLASFQKGAYILEVTANDSTQTQTIIRE